MHTNGRFNKPVIWAIQGTNNQGTNSKNELVMILRKTGQYGQNLGAGEQAGYLKASDKLY